MGRDYEIPLTQYVPQERIAAAIRRHDAAYDYAIKAGEHYWIVVLTHAVSRDALERLPEPPTLDTESLIGNPMVGCYICEQSYEPRLLRRRCPGEPKD